MIKKPPNFRKDIGPGKVFITWEITYKCNYKCSYCNYSGAGYEPTPTIYPGIQALVKAWEDVYKKYGSCHIHLAGGEPFFYPGIMDFIIKISQIHTWECSTNLSWDPDDLIKHVKPGRARIGVSYHPEFTDFDTFLIKTKKLKDAGFEVWANYVAHPSIMKGMDMYKHKFSEIGVSMSILPFNGTYNNIVYPKGYNQEERSVLESLAVEPWSKKTLDFVFDKQILNQNIKCRMGQMYAKIYANGDAFSCCAQSAVKLGNLIEGTFNLLNEPFACGENNCACWKRMNVGEESKWALHWVVPPDGRLK